jgi:hypothetical protein
MNTVRWIPDDGLEVATAPRGYLLKAMQIRSGEWDWALYHDDEMVARGMGDTEEDAKSAAVRAYQEHAETLDA